MPVDMEVRDLSRKDVRYRLYRIKTDPSAQVDPDDGLKDHFESQPEFDGWHNFAVTWDVGAAAAWPDGHFVVVPLKESLETQWQKTLLGLAADPPKAEAPDTCAGTKADGDPCGNKAGEDGYCHLHGPDEDD